MILCQEVCALTWNGNTTRWIGQTETCCNLFDVGAPVSADTGTVCIRNRLRNPAGLMWVLFLSAWYNAADVPVKQNNSLKSVTCPGQRHTDNTRFQSLWLFIHVNSILFVLLSGMSCFCCSNGPVGPQRWLMFHLIFKRDDIMRQLSQRFKCRLRHFVNRDKKTLSVLPRRRKKWQQLNNPGGLSIDFTC